MQGPRFYASAFVHYSYEPGDGVTEEVVAAAADPGAAGPAGGMSVAQLRAEAVYEGIPLPDQRRTIREPGSIGSRPRTGW